MTEEDKNNSDQIHKVYEMAADSAFGSKLVINNFRGLIAEAIVALALQPYWTWCSEGWNGWDFERDDGLKLEVKQSARRQTWSIDGKFTHSSFDIAEKYQWGENGERWAGYKCRAAQIYVFAHHVEISDNINHKDPNQWEFYVLPTSKLPNQKRISLNPLKSLCEPCGFDKLLERVNDIAKAVKPLEGA